jgi:hypothetical protein
LANDATSTHVLPPSQADRNCGFCCISSNTFAPSGSFRSCATFADGGELGPLFRTFLGKPSADVWRLSAWSWI